MARALALLLCAAALAITACSGRDERPNIVLIVSDDQSWVDFGFMGSPHVKTPNLDRLAREGTVFTHGYNTASICRPSLRSLLTGLQPMQWGHQIWRLRQAGIERPFTEGIADFETLPRILGERGYKSFEGGKFWEADYRVAGFTHGLQEPGDDPSHGGVGRFLGRDSLEPLTGFIDAHGDEPFFVWFSPMLPHYPHDPPARFRARYAGGSYSDPAVLYYANVDRLDEVVGDLLAHLDARGLRERTLVVFLADNGWDQAPDQAWPGVHAGPRGKKTLYELGFRTPIVFHWPGVVPAGVRRDELVSTVDLFPTFLDYAGAPLPAGRTGRSLRPLLEGSDAWEREAIVGHMSNVLLPPELRDVPASPGGEYSGAFLRTRRWRYVWYDHIDRDALYDIEADPGEARNLAAENPALVADFRTRIRRWKQEMARPFPVAPRPTDLAGPGR